MTTTKFVLLAPLKVALTNATPRASWLTIHDVEELPESPDYAPGGVEISADGVAVFTADDQPLGPFMYAVVYNSDTGALIAWYQVRDRFPIVLSKGESFTFDARACFVAAPDPT